MDAGRQRTRPAGVRAIAAGIQYVADQEGILAEIVDNQSRRRSSRGTAEFRAGGFIPPDGENSDRRVNPAALTGRALTGGQASIR